MSSFDGDCQQSSGQKVREGPHIDHCVLSVVAMPLVVKMVRPDRDTHTGMLFSIHTGRGEIVNLRAAGNPNWLNLDAPELSNGLTNAQHAEFTELYGPNCLTPPDEMSELMKFAMQFTGFFSLLLIVGGLLCMIAYVANPEGTENVCPITHCSYARLA